MSRYQVNARKVLSFLLHNDDQLTLVQRKSQFPCGILFLHLAQKQVQIWGRRISSIVGFRSPNFAQRNILVYWNRINRHFEVWEKKYREMEFRPLGNESSPFCRTEWFHIHVKTAFFHLRAWLIIGQSGWKLRQRSRFDSWQFVGQAEKWCWADIANFANLGFFKFWNFNLILKFTYLMASFSRFGESHVSWAMSQDTSPHPHCVASWGLQTTPAFSWKAMLSWLCQWLCQAARQRASHGLLQCTGRRASTHWSRPLAPSINPSAAQIWPCLPHCAEHWR